MSATNALNETYSEVYSGLTELRELFHVSGNIDDSNAKLDEVAKLFTTYLSFVEGKIDKFPDASSKTIVEDLHSAFNQAAKLPDFANQDGTSIFGNSPTLVFKKTDTELAAAITRVVVRSVDSAIKLRDQGVAFDVLNEAFGHFVRDNFRGNVEDAQYMTPPEVVQFMVELAFGDIEIESGKLTDATEPFTIMDPTCGVGSFLTAAFHKAKTMDLPNLERFTVVGQDKIERMVRLTKINLSLFSAGDQFAFIGNSLDKNSPIAEFEGKVDLILTNPPFGARIPGDFVKLHGTKSMPYLSQFATSKNTLDSEILFIERNLELLRPGGRMLIVVPDGVISARGIAATLRQALSSTIEIRAIIDLPTEAFAQTGTRTRTAILYLVKKVPTQKSITYLGVIDELGFKVTLKKGIQTKVYQGENQLKNLSKILSKQKSVQKIEIVSDNPSIVVAPQSALDQSGWTPNHYSASRLRMLEELSSDEEMQLVPLNVVATFESNARRAEKPIKNGVFISVLHLLSEGVIDFKALEEYKPITPGYVVYPGEVLISKINPRIPRVCVVPDLGVPTQCSSEFEVLSPQAEHSPSELAFLLQSDEVQAQIQKLTSGTSSSHNRIKTKELELVMIPLPKNGTRSESKHKKDVKDYEEALKNVEIGLKRIVKIRSGK